MSVTIADVAKRAGVAKSTVSKYINNGTLRPSEKERVETAIRELNYVPSALARGLKNMKSFTVGVIIPTLDSSFSMQILSAMEQELQKYGYGAIISDCSGEQALEVKALEFLHQKTVDAFVLLPSAVTDKHLKELNKPVILFDRPVANFSSDIVLIDNEKAGYVAMKHILDHGHTNVGLLLGAKNVYTSDKRLIGAQRACEEYGIPLENCHWVHTDYTMGVAMEKTFELMASDNPPTAILAFNADTTLGCVIALNQMHLSIPDDISVVGFDNFSISKFANPAITIIYQNHKKIGEKVAKLVLNRLHGDKSEPAVEMVDFELIEGASVKQIK